MPQKRAKIGGEIGLNGEPYKGGAFICTTERGKGAKRKAATRKVEVGPYEWAVPPTPESRPLYVGAVGGVFHQKDGWHRPLSCVSDTALAYLGLTREQLADRIARHAAGERWL